MKSAAAPEGLARHPLPQSTLHVPLFAGVEAPILGFEVVAVAVFVHLVGLRWLPLAMFGAGLAAAHLGLARATAKDRRLAMVFARSVRYPAYARPWAVLDLNGRHLERRNSGQTASSDPTFPRRLLA